MSTFDWPIADLDGPGRLYSGTATGFLLQPRGQFTSTTVQWIVPRDGATGFHYLVGAGMEFEIFGSLTALGDRSRPATYSGGRLVGQQTGIVFELGTLHKLHSATFGFLSTRPDYTIDLYARHATGTSDLYVLDVLNGGGHETTHHVAVLGTGVNPRLPSFNTEGYTWTMTIGSDTVTAFGARGFDIMSMFLDVIRNTTTGSWADVDVFGAGNVVGMNTKTDGASYAVSYGVTGPGALTWDLTYPTVRNTRTNMTPIEGPAGELLDYRANEPAELVHLLFN